MARRRSGPFGCFFSSPDDIEKRPFVLLFCVLLLLGAIVVIQVVFYILVSVCVCVNHQLARHFLLFNSVGRIQEEEEEEEKVNNKFENNNSNNNKQEEEERNKKIY